MNLDIYVPYPLQKPCAPPPNWVGLLVGELIRARFRNFLAALAGKKTLVNIFQDTLTLEYGEQPLSRYSVEWQPDDKHLLRVGNPRLYGHPYQSLQLSLWQPGEVEWLVIICREPAARRHHRKGRVMFLQPLLFPNIDATQG